MTCRIAGVYELFNTKSMKSYVGSSYDILKRCARHEKMLDSGTHYNKHLQASWDFYGGDTFEFYILEECVREQLVQREQHYIDMLQPKYNVCQIAGINDSNRGKTFSEEWKKRISESLKGHKLSEEHKHSLSKSHLGKHFSEEHKKKMSLALMGNRNNPGGNFAGQHHTEETKRKISESLKSCTGWHHSEETKRKISERLKGNKNGKGRVRP